MKTRASTAMMFALNLSLHVHNEVEDEYTEARRRVWWMTYTCVCQSSIVSNTVGNHGRVSVSPIY